MQKNIDWQDNRQSGRLDETPPCFAKIASHDPFCAWGHASGLPTRELAERTGFPR